MNWEPLGVFDEVFCWGLLVRTVPETFLCDVAFGKIGLLLGKKLRIQKAPFRKTRTDRVVGWAPQNEETNPFFEGNPSKKAVTSNTVDGRNPAPFDRLSIPFGVFVCILRRVQDFFHPFFRFHVSFQWRFVNFRVCCYPQNHSNRPPVDVRFKQIFSCCIFFRWTYDPCYV